jgi:citrate lyase subunit beta/citryl-CoA lyase
MMWALRPAADIGAGANCDAQGRYAALTSSRSLALLGAAAAQVPAIDAVYTNFRDTDGLKAEAAEALRDGYSAKAAIHPDQIGPINAAFTPSDADVAWARRVLAAFDGSPGAGAIAIDGDTTPHYCAAQRGSRERRPSNVDPQAGTMSSAETRYPLSITVIDLPTSTTDPTPRFSRRWRART